MHPSVTEIYEMQELRLENAKLLKMVRIYQACHEHINACRGCVEWPDCDAIRKLRELGVEVES